MNKSIIYTIVFSILFTIAINSCKSKMAYSDTEKIITKSCELNNRVNDTVTINGIFHYGLEYLVFTTIQKDSCKEKYKINLNFDYIEFPKDLAEQVYKIAGPTNMIVKGVLKNDNEYGYGHLNMNNHELIVLKILNIDGYDL